MSSPESANAATSDNTQATTTTWFQTFVNTVQAFYSMEATAVAQVLGLWTAARAAVSTVASGVAAAAANKTILAANAKYQDVPLTPAVLADAIVRNILPDDTGEPNQAPAGWPAPLMTGINGGGATDEVALSGINGDRFHALVADTGESYGIIDALRLYNRGQNLHLFEQTAQYATGTPLYQATAAQPDNAGISLAELYNVIAYSRVRNQFADDLMMLSKETATAADVVEMAVKQIISTDDAQVLYEAAGGMGEQFHMLVDAAGDSAGVEKATELAAHGVLSSGELTQIVAMSRLNPRFYYLTEPQDDANGVPQAYLAPLNRKWLPPYEIKEAVAANPALAPQALEWMLEQGYPEDQAKAFAASLVTTATATAKTETETMVLAELQAGMITQADATTALQNLGYTTASIPFLLDYAQAKAVNSARNAAISRIRTGYLAGVTTTAEATAAMTQAGVPSATITSMLAEWTAEASVPHTALSAAEIGWFLEHGVMDTATATTYWKLRGYTAADVNYLIQRYPPPTPTTGG